MKEASVKLPNGKVHYLFDGSGPALVLLHSVGRSARSWLPVTGRLAGTFSVYALDMMGHGGSGRPRPKYTVPDFVQDVVSFMDSQGIRKASVMGNSIGGVIAAELAARHPQRVDRLALVGCPGWETEAERQERLTLSSANFDEKGCPKRQTLEDLALSYAHPTPQLLEEVNADRARAGPWVRKSLVAVCSHDLMPSLARISCPTLVVFGEKDLLRDKEQALVRRIKGSRLAIVKDAGHLPQVDAPQPFLEAVESFLKG